MKGVTEDSEQVRCEVDGLIFFIPRKLFYAMALRCQYSEKKYIRYKEGAKMYSMSEREFNKLAHDAGAVHKVKKMALVKIATVDEYLEYFKE